MAIRNILKVGEEGEEILRKTSKQVTVFDHRLHTLIDDMIDTMRDANGAGLAAPQVGILKRVVVIEVEGKLYELVNPVIVSQEGEQEVVEGCLSIPNQAGVIMRPFGLTIQAQDRNGAEITMSGEEFLAKAMCHELDHLDGVLYTDKAIEMLSPEEFMTMHAEDDDEEM